MCATMQGAVMRWCPSLYFNFEFSVIHLSQRMRVCFWQQQQLLYCKNNLDIDNSTSCNWFDTSSCILFLTLFCFNQPLIKLTEHQLIIASTDVGAMLTTPACKEPSDNDANLPWTPSRCWFNPGREDKHSQQDADMPYWPSIRLLQLSLKKALE